MTTRKCLVVEDSSLMRQLLVIGVTRIRNLDVAEAGDGIEAIRMMAEAEYDIFVVDINMPIMDGLKLIKHIRSDPVHQKKPIIVVTTEGAEENRQRASLLGVNEYLTKPVRAPQIVSAIERLLK